MGEWIHNNARRLEDTVCLWSSGKVALYLLITQRKYYVSIKAALKENKKQVLKDVYRVVHLPLYLGHGGSLRWLHIVGSSPRVLCICFCVLFCSFTYFLLVSVFLILLIVKLIFSTSPEVFMNPYSSLFRSGAQNYGVIILYRSWPYLNPDREWYQIYAI